MTTTTPNISSDDQHVHKFERAGLGQAPFRCVGFSEERGPIRRALPNGVMMEIGSPGQPMGTCDYCGQGIANVFHILSADGRRFKVGCDCVQKTGDAGLVKVVSKQANKIRREATAKRNAERIAALRAELAADYKLTDLLKSRPHPLAWRAEQGDTRLDWVTWMLKNSGETGRMKVVRWVDKLKAGKI